MTRYNKRNRLTALGLAVLMTASAIVPACAEPIGDGVVPTCDEAYYATLDYYGNLVEGSVVKSYALNGADSITDYGVYDEVVNLTDRTVPTQGQGTTSFRFDQALDHFYFEGKTEKPFQELPWTISLHYTLNGVPTKAEDLAGKTGVVEILLDVEPNESASDYARYNYTLEAMALFNQDDILSLEAPGAQVQLVGNLRTVLFLCLPGEERHFSIRVGSDDFSFAGMTILLVPATLAQLEEINKLSQRKDELEEDYEALSGSLDDLLDALSDIQGGLYASASGLDQLEIARGTISGGKGLIYDEAGVLRGDLSDIAGLLEPVEQRTQTLSQAITDAKGVLNGMVDETAVLQERLKTLENALAALESGTGDVKDLLESAADLKDSLNSLSSALGGVNISTGGSSVSGTALVNQVRQVHSAYETARGGSKQAAFTALLTLQGESASSAAAKAAQAAALSDALAGGADINQVIDAKTLEVLKEKMPGLPEEQYVALLGSEAGQAARAQVASEINAQLPGIRQLESLQQAAQALSFQKFCENLPGITKEQAKQMNDLWLIESGGKASTQSAADQMSVSLPAVSTGLLSAALVSGVYHSAAAAAPGVVGEQPAAQEGNGSDAPPAQETPSVQEDNEPETPPAQEDNEPETPPAQGDNEPETPPTQDDGESEAPPSQDSGSDENQTPGGAAVDLIASGLDSANNKINSIQQELNNTLNRITNPTARVVRELASVCSQLDDLTDLVDDAADVSAAVRGASQEIRTILDSVQQLDATLNEYEPVLQDALANLGSMSTAAVTTIRDLEQLLTDTEALMKASGEELDAGTKQTLRGLSAALRQTAKALAATGGVRDAKGTITDIIEDTWEEYTGKVNNMLLMDAEAQAESLTDSRNPAPSSVQVLIRTQEIKTEEPEKTAQTAAEKETTTFWGRIAQMFQDFWNAITGMFH